MTLARSFYALALALMAAGCAPVVPAPEPPPPPSLASPGPGPSSTGYRLPAEAAASYRKAAAAGARIYTIDSEKSLIVVTVRRGGALARLGHDHVVASHAITGMLDPAAGRADLGFRLDAMVVDEAPLREQARLDTQPSPEAIAGTRQNMLTRVLEAERYPEVALQVRTAPVRPPLLSTLVQAATLRVTLHGVTRELPVTITLTPTAHGLVASGLLRLRQSDFGITPMAVMGGAMTVQDEMELRYWLATVAP